jgi:hypothetical protein
MQFGYDRNELDLCNFCYYYGINDDLFEILDRAESQEVDELLDTTKAAAANEALIAHATCEERKIFSSFR